MGVYGPHTQVKCVFKALISDTCEKNTITYSQMRFQLYQLHSVTATGLKMAKSPNIGSGPFRDLIVTLKSKLQTSNLSHTKIMQNISDLLLQS